MKATRVKDARSRERLRIAERLRSLRKARGLSQTSLAGTEFTKGYISQLETGRVGLSVRAANVFSRRLGIQVDDLLRAPDLAEHTVELALLEAERELAQGSPERALQMGRQIRAGGQLQGRAFRLQGRTLLRLDRAGDAIGILSRAIESFRASGDREGQIRTFYDLAYAYARLDQPQQALVHLLQCKQALLAGELVDRTVELEVESFLASTYARMGDHNASAPHLERARALAEDVVSHDALAAVYGRLASAEQQAGRMEKALALWRKCLRELELTGRQRQIADIWHNMATTYLRLGSHEEARAALSRADELHKQTAHSRLGAWLQVTRAKLALDEGQLAGAQRLAQEASTDTNAIPLARAEAHLVLAQVLSRRRAPIAEIRASFEAALTELASEPPGSRVRALKLYADALSLAGDSASAFNKAREALELVRPGG